MGNMNEKAIPVSAQERTVDGIGIHGAILAIYKENKLYAQKASRNQAQSYNYTSEADFLALIRPQLAEHDVVVFPQYEVLSQSVFTTAKGSPMRQVTIRGRFNFVHVPSATGIIVETIGEGMDQQDKAPYKAMTGALKYAIRQTFLVETGDDPEDDSKDKKEETAKQPPAAPATTGPQPSRFEADLNVELKRLGFAVYKAALKEFLPEMTEGFDLTTLPSPTKKALVAFLKTKPTTA